MDRHHRYDILMVSDFRFPGGTSASLAEEIRAQATAGYRTGLVQVNGPLVAGIKGFNRRIRHCIESGIATLVPPSTAVEARLAVLRHPAVFDAFPGVPPVIRADRVVLVANQAPHDIAGQQPYYDVRRVDRAVRQWMGCAITWAPIGPLVRATIAPYVDAVDIEDIDWHNVIDVDEWHVDRARYVGSRPVIGRHSRPQFPKWPATAEDLRAAYPDDGSVLVRVLGGAKIPSEILGHVPDAWKVEAFDARPVPEFLRDIDFFVYFHHPELVEAFGRTTLEALASGTVAILPAHFRALFEDAAVYGKPADVRGLVGSIYADPAAYRIQSERGTDFVRERFGAASHVTRIREFLGPPGDRAVPVPTRRRVSPPRVLFVSSNGAGMGHLTRLMAMARRASERVRPIFFSLSQAVPVVGAEGFPYEYCPSRGALGVPTGEWNRMFGRRFVAALERHRPEAVVFDGTWPYLGLIEARERFPEIAFVWSRRAMWKEDTPPDQLRKQRYFDLVVEPGEFAAAFDRGPTRQADALRVDPVVLLDPQDVMDRATARAALDLDLDRPAVLVTLGAGNINDLSSDLGVVVAVLSVQRERQIVVTKPPIAGAGAAFDPARVRHLSTYPLSRYANAFDFAVSATGYNSYHEHIAFGLPTIFVPNLLTRTDNQLARARYAQQVGVGRCLPSVSHDAFADAMAEFDVGSTRSTMAAACRKQWPGNGAADAMTAVESLLDRRRMGGAA